MEGKEVNKELLQIFSAAVTAVQPERLIPQYLKLYDGNIQLGDEVIPETKIENFFVAGAGKAAAAMSAEVEKVLGYRIKDGAVAIKAGQRMSLKYIRQVEAGHPVPDDNSVVAANEIAGVVKKAHRHDAIIFLLSGGASSLMMDIPYGCSLQEIQTVFELLLKSGASIDEVNVVRKHLSELKGGQLLRDVKSHHIFTFIISDVIGNDLSIIGSGPTAPDPSTFTDAMAILEKYELTKSIPPPVMNHLEKGAGKIIHDTLKEKDRIFNHCSNYIIGDNNMALQAAAGEASALGYETRIITSTMSGDAEEAAKKWADDVLAHKSQKKYCLVAGGETTVKVTGSGKGGRNQQFALAAGIALQHEPNISLLAAGTDGNDGPTDAAGAVVDHDTMAAARDKGLDAEKYLRNNDAYTFFDRSGGLLKTGPTQTNVMDIVVTLIN